MAIIPTGDLSYVKRTTDALRTLRSKKYLEYTRLARAKSRWEKFDRSVLAEQIIAIDRVLRDRANSASEQ